MRTFLVTGTTVVAITAALAAQALGGGASATALPSGNLLQNPGAEAGAGAVTYESVPVPSWQVTNDFTAVTYKPKALDMVSLEEAAGFGGGVNQFVGGGGRDAVSTATQTVDVSADGRIIDAGTVLAKLSALIGGSRAQEDNGKVDAAFLDEAGGTLGQVAVGPVTATDRKRISALLPREATAPVPPGTRSIRVTMTATRVHGSYNETSFDNLSLSLTEAPAPHAALKVAAKCAGGKVVATARATARLRIASVSFATKGAPAVEDAAGPFTATLPLATPGKAPQVVTATVTDTAGRSWTFTQKLRPCPVKPTA